MPQYSLLQIIALLSVLATAALGQDARSFQGRVYRPNGQPLEFSLRVEIQGRETVVVPAGTFQTIRVEPKSTGSGLMGKNLVLWLTDDARKIPVQIRSKLKVGTLVGRLRSIEKTGSTPAALDLRRPERESPDMAQVCR